MGFTDLVCAKDGGQILALRRLPETDPYDGMRLAPDTVHGRTYRLAGRRKDISDAGHK